MIIEASTVLDFQYFNDNPKKQFLVRRVGDDESGPQGLALLIRVIRPIAIMPIFVPESLVDQHLSQSVLEALWNRAEVKHPELRETRITIESERADAEVIPMQGGSRWTH